VENLKRYEELMEEFSYKSYMYVGDTIRISIQDKEEMPLFIMGSPELESKLDKTKRSELTTILQKAMTEVIKYKEPGQSIKDFLGWKD
jgi:hypothetical protein